MACNIKEGGIMENVVLTNKEVESIKFLTARIQTLTELYNKNQNEIVNEICSVKMVMSNHMKELKNKYELKPDLDKLKVDFYTNTIKEIK